MVVETARGGDCLPVPECGLAVGVTELLGL